MNDSPVKYTKNININLRPLEDNELIQAGDFFSNKGEENKIKSVFGSIGDYPSDFEDKNFWRMID